jgi:hypothetical protein
MSRVTISLLLLAFAVTGLAMTVRAQQEPPPEEASQPQPQPESPMPVCEPDRILVKVQPGFDPATVIARYGGTIVRTIPGIEVQVVTVPAGQGQQAIDALVADPEVQYAEADQIVTAAQAGSGC